MDSVIERAYSLKDAAQLALTSEDHSDDFLDPGLLQELINVIDALLRMSDHAR